MDAVVDKRDGRAHGAQIPFPGMTHHSLGKPGTFAPIIGELELCPVQNQLFGGTFGHLYPLK